MLTYGKHVLVTIHVQSVMYMKEISCGVLSESYCGLLSSGWVSLLLTCRVIRMGEFGKVGRWVADTGNILQNVTVVKNGTWSGCWLAFL